MTSKKRLEELVETSVDQICEVKCSYNGDTFPEHKARWILEALVKAVVLHENVKPSIPASTLEAIYDEAALSIEDGNPLLEHKRGLEAVAVAVAHATVEMLEGSEDHSPAHGYSRVSISLQ